MSIILKFGYGVADFVIFDEAVETFGAFVCVVGGEWCGVVVTGAIGGGGAQFRCGEIALDDCFIMLLSGGGDCEECD